MSLEAGARTVVEDCLSVQPGETVVVLNDSNDPALVQSLMEVLEETGADAELLEYEEPENHGEEPPEQVARAMREADVFIAPTVKSVTHTEARHEACESGARGAMMPGITEEVWNSALQADYSRVKEISEELHGLVTSSGRLRITTLSGTDLEFEVEPDSFKTDTGVIHGPGEAGNLPAGEADGGAVGGEGRLVVDHLPMAEGSEGAVLEIEDNSVKDFDAPEGSLLARKLEELDCMRNIAEVGIGANPEAELVGNLLQDEKVLGTVHVALGDNSSYFPKGDSRRVECPAHWDSVCIEPTLELDGETVIEAGEPVFLD